MKKETIIKCIIVVVLLIVLGGLCFIVLQKNDPNAPERGNRKGLFDFGSNPSSVDAKGATTIKDTQTAEGETYSSETSNENALLIQDGGNLTLSSSKINKTGDAEDENADFYGTNAGILVNNKGKLDLTNSDITTNGTYANGLFVYGKGNATVKDTTISTEKNNSGGIMVAGGGTLDAQNLTVTTQGNSSAAIRSDRGGGTMTITKGTYTTNGIGSPVIYSTADVTVNDATLVATKSEGAVVEGKNSITLNNVTLTDTNTILNGNSETYKNIFLYQSMSGDAEKGVAKFTAKDSTITTNQGDTIFVTNTKAEINLTNNTIINNDEGFLRIQTGKWGKEGSNGGEVTLNANNQKISGDVFVDSISTLEFNLKEESYYEGAINQENQAKSITLKLDSNSKIKLTGNTYVTSLEDADTSYGNIDFNGYKLYVNGKAIN